jgi:hypothetical protein
MIRLLREFIYIIYIDTSMYDKAKFYYQSKKK